MFSPLQKLAERIRRGDSISPPLALLLSAATCGQRFGMWRRLRAPRTRVDARVISFGNLCAGGTGKTPAVIERAAREAAAGRKVAVLTRGYGSARTVEPLCVGPDETQARRYQLAGDEAALIARRVPGLWIVKSAGRVAGAWTAIQQCGCDTLILEDGYQAVALERDENILLVDARNPFGNGQLLPRGILREPIEALGRATEIILTRCDEAAEADAVAAEIREHCPGIPIRRTRHAPHGLWRLSDGFEAGLDFLRDREVRAVCGIAQPETFFASLEALGAKLAGRRAYPDHASLPAHAFEGDTPVIITEKDAMRVAGPTDNVYALSINLEDL